MTNVIRIGSKEYAEERARPLKKPPKEGGYFVAMFDVKHYNMGRCYNLYCLKNGVLYERKTGGDWSVAKRGFDNAWATEPSEFYRLVRIDNRPLPHIIPCPLCGNDDIAVIETEPHSNNFVATCLECGMGPPTWPHLTRRHAVAIWNERAFRYSQPSRMKR